MALRPIVKASSISKVLMINFACQVILIMGNGLATKYISSALKKAIRGGGSRSSKAFIGDSCWACDGLGLGGV